MWNKYPVARKKVPIKILGPFEEYGEAQRVKVSKRVLQLTEINPSNPFIRLAIYLYDALIDLVESHVKKSLCKE